MGYVKRNARVYRLVWDDGHPLAGLEVRVRSLPLGAFLTASGAIAALSEGDVTAESLTAVREPLQALVDSVVSWNIQQEAPDGTLRDVPVTLTEFLNLEPAEWTGIIREWQKAVASVPAPLAGPSPSGEQVASLPMVESAKNPGN